MNSCFVTIAENHRWLHSRHCSGSGPDESRQITTKYAAPPTNPGSTTIPWGLLKQPDKHVVTKSHQVTSKYSANPQRARRAGALQNLAEWRAPPNVATASWSAVALLALYRCS